MFLNLEENFCDSRFFDLDHLWYSQYPVFTKCFEETVFAWIPSLILWISAPSAIAAARKGGYGKSTLPFSFINIAKYSFTTLLVTLNFSCGLYILIDTDIRRSSVSWITVRFLKTFSYFLVLCLQRMFQLVGRRTSNLLCVFWVVDVVCNVPAYFRVLLAVFFDYGSDLQEPVEFLVEIVGFHLILTQFFLSFVLDSVKDYDEEDIKRPYLGASIYSLISFGWLTPLMYLGFKRTITYSDLYRVPKELASVQCSMGWNRLWSRLMDPSSSKEVRKSVDVHKLESKQVPPSLLKLLFRLYWRPVAVSFSFELLRTVIRMLPALLIDLVIQNMSDQGYVWKGVLYSLGIFFTNFMAFILFRHVNFLSSMTGLSMRSVLINAVYAKALKMTSQSKEKYTIGELVNLIAVDSEKIYRFLQTLPVSFSSLPIFVIVFALLWGYVGASAISGIVTICVMVPISATIARAAKGYQAKQMVLKDRRMKQINEILVAMKTLKMFAWEEMFARKVCDIRSQEVSYLMKFAYVTAVVRSFAICTPMFATMVIFLTFVFVSADNALTPNVVFVSLTLLANIRQSMLFIPEFVSGLVQLNVSLRRIRNFLLCDELECQRTHIGSKSSVSLKNVTASWFGEEGTVLKDVNLTVKSGELVAVVGRVGSGKTALLSSILGEISIADGLVDVSGSVAYVPQDAWIQNSSVQRNIVFTATWNLFWYNKVLDMCCLMPDLEMCPDGDLTEIGERGINLSGGQKQRLSLARAVYQDRDIYLLDDPLSAVDAQVATALIQKVIGSNGVLKDKARILVTNNLAVLPEADRIIVLRYGEIIENGSYESLTRNRGYLSDLVSEFSQGREKVEKSEVCTKDDAIQNGKTICDKDVEKMSNIDTMVGRVRMKVYFTYFKHMGLLSALAVLLFYAAYRSFEISASVWLGEWSSVEGQSLSERNVNILIYVLLGFGQGVFAFVSIALLARASIVATTKLHAEMLSAVMRAPMCFFDTTPVGRLLNRFGKDIDLLDIQFPGAGTRFLESATTIIGVLILISLNIPVFLIGAIVALGIYFFLLVGYQRTYRAVQRLEAVTRSPVYSFFSETISGVSSVRAYGVEKDFLTEFQDRTDVNQNCLFHLMVMNKWLRVWLDALSQFMVLMACLLVVLSTDVIDVSDAGLLISYSLTSSISYGMLVQSTSEVEAAVVSAERIHETCCLPSEGTWCSSEGSSDRKKNWLTSGEIHFVHYSARYREGLDLVLRDINIHIPSGKKIGIVGRTGAGKSSLILALFRLIEAACGKIIIDGTNIAELNLQELRGSLTIIPQDPVLFNGSLRANLDPNGEHEEAHLYAAMQRAHLDAFLSDGLETHVAEGGANLSVGQRQLVCLARAILKKSKILLLDEATASVDLETESLIQKAIGVDFVDCTVITIAHRIQTVLDSDEVLVMDAGRVIERGLPVELIQNPRSVFYELYTKGSLFVREMS